MSQPPSSNNNAAAWVIPIGFITVITAFVIEWMTDRTFLQALMIAAPVAVLLRLGFFLVVRFRRRQNRTTKQPTAEPEVEPVSESDLSESIDDEPEPEPATPAAAPDREDVTATSTNIPVIRQPSVSDRFVTESLDLDVPDSIADLPSYSELLHPWSYYRNVVAAGFLALITLVLFAWVSVSEGPWTEMFTAGPWLLPALWLLWLLGVGLSVLLLIRRHKIWVMRPLTCDPRSGILTIFETGSRLWVIPNSEPDQYPLSEVSIDSPKQTWFEQYVLRDSYTLVLMGEGKPRVIRYVRDIRKIKDIAAAYRSIVTQQRDLQREILKAEKQRLELARQQLVEQQRNNELLAELLESQRRVEYTVTQLPPS